METEKITTISPSTNKPVVERNGLTDTQLESLINSSERAFETYRTTTLQQRQAIVSKALEAITQNQDELAKELTEQMGRPISYAAKEVATAVLRGQYLLRVSSEALADTPGDAEPGFKRYIRKMPIGPVLVIFAWNVSD
jgi:acyl-CoA reductase-like NAD-dependent aldehyde dehydrogenase